MTEQKKEPVESARTGQCRCGNVQFSVAGPPLITMACHCRGCQLMTASAFSLSELYPAAAFTVISGEPILGGMKAQPRHFFCPDCMSWMFTRIDETAEFVNVRATMMDDCESFTPFIESCTEEKLPWAATGAAYSFEKFPGPEDYPGLITEFQQIRQAADQA